MYGYQKRVHYNNDQVQALKRVHKMVSLCMIVVVRTVFILRKNYKRRENVEQESKRIKGECMQDEGKALLSCCQTARLTHTHLHTHLHSHVKLSSNGQLWISYKGKHIRTDGQADRQSDWYSKRTNISHFMKDLTFKCAERKREMLRLKAFSKYPA